MIPLVAACITDHDRRYLRQRIDDGLLDDETEVRRFEEAFAERVGCAEAVAVCSGTVALKLVRFSEKVIPSWSCVALRNAAAEPPKSGRIRYLDSRFDVPTATMKLGLCRLGPKESIWIPHGFGTPTIGGWQGCQHQITEDYTLSLGAIPSLSGLVGVCSTHWSKMISTGRGGVVFGNNLEFLSQIREIAYYETHLAEASSYGMSALQAALGVSQLQQLDKFIERRREIARLYSERFRSAGIECPDRDLDGVFFRYLIAVTDPASKVEALAGYGIEVGRGVYPPLHRLAGLPDDAFPGTVESVNRLLSVPCHPSISDAEADYIAHRIIGLCAP